MSKFVQLWLVLVLAPACLEAQTTAVTNSNNGTANTVPAYTGSATLGNSVITQSGNNIGINLGAGNTPDATLVISGGNGAHDGIGDVVTAIEGNSTTGPQLWMGNTPGGVYDGHEWSLMASGSSNVLLGSGSAGKFALIDRTYGIPRFVIDGAGNFGLGTASPTSAFHLYSGDMTIGSYNLNFPTPPSGSSSINRLSNVSLLRETLGDGSGRFNIYWNAYNDSNGNGNQYYVTNEPAVKWNIGGTSGSPGGTALYVAPSSGNPGSVTWNTVFSADANGNTTLANSAMYLKAGANGSFGNVGIGTTSPGAAYKLDVEGGQVNSSGGYCINGTNCISSWPTTGSNTWTGTQTFNGNIQVNGAIINTAGSFTKYSGYTLSMAPVADGTYGGYLLLARAYTSGDVADSEIQGRFTFSRGATTAGNRTDVLEVSSKSAYQSEYFVVNGLNSYGSYVTGLFHVTYQGVVYDAIGLTATGGNTNDGAIFDGFTINATPLIVTSNGVTNATPYGSIGTFVANGNVGIGTTSPAATLEVNGTAKVDSTLQVSSSGIAFPGSSTPQTTPWTGVLCGGDYAESVDPADAKEAYGPGDVLVITDGEKGDIQKSIQPYATSVAGVFATKPGVVGRRQTLPDSGREIPMAMVGIVPTKVTAENGPIHRGDLLVTSSKAGYAMKGTDRSRMLGAVIGKAMGALESGAGVIEVLVTLQ